MSKSSVFLFTVSSSKDPFDTVLVKAEPSMRRFIVYDPRKGRKSNEFAAQIDLLRPFVADYIENFSAGKFSVRDGEDSNNE